MYTSNVVSEWVSKNWKIVTFNLSIFILGSLLLLFKIGTIPKGLSSLELNTYTKLTSNTLNIHYFIHHLSSGPFLKRYLILNFLHLHSLIFIRSIGYLFGLLVIYVFFYTVLKLTNSFVAILSTLLFTTNLWFLQLIRNDQNLIFYALATTALISLILLFIRSKRRDVISLPIAALVACLIYVPGMIWLLLLCSVVFFKPIRQHFKNLKLSYQIFLPIIFLLFIAPLGIYYKHFKSKILSLTYIPNHLSSTTTLLHRLIEYPLNLLIYNFNTSQLSIGNLPIFDLASVIFIIFGAYWAFINRKQVLFKYIALGIVVGWILFIFNGATALYFALPLFSLLIAFGIYYFHSEWQGTFPRNPYPRTIGIILLILLVSVVVLYHIDQYFVVWPHTSQVLAIYDHYL
ncbi:MAG TPA: hypothetical protein VMR76_01075 [Candidatus Saccharimonadia bacterium]|nr:hypothetical protein [Candidatus Saccharimonadia bacterium]